MIYPSRVRLLILEALFPSETGSQVARLASVSQEWQAVVEPSPSIQALHPSGAAADSRWIIPV